MSSTMKGVIGLQEKFQSLIDEVMDNFDFNKVHKVMKFLNWTWAFAAEGVPEVYELKEQARRLLNECLYDMIKHGEDNWNIGTGGFYARATNYKEAEVEEDDFHLSLKLSFELEDWDAY